MKLSMQDTSYYKLLANAIDEVNQRGQDLDYNVYTSLITQVEEKFSRFACSDGAIAGTRKRIRELQLVAAVTHTAPYEELVARFNSVSALGFSNCSVQAHCVQLFARGCCGIGRPHEGAAALQDLLSVLLEDSSCKNIKQDIANINKLIDEIDRHFDR